MNVEPHIIFAWQLVNPNVLRSMLSESCTADRTNIALEFYAKSQMVLRVISFYSSLIIPEPTYSSALAIIFSIYNGALYNPPL